jgi:hypothetical protein
VLGVGNDDTKCLLKEEQYNLQTLSFLNTLLTLVRTERDSFLQLISLLYLLRRRVHLNCTAGFIIPLTDHWYGCALVHVFMGSTNSIGECLRVAKLVTKFDNSLILLCSQKPATGPFPSQIYPVHTFTLYFLKNILISCHLCLRLPSDRLATIL